MSKLKLISILLAAILLLTGCNVSTVKDLYSLPKRSEAYNNLQSLIDQAMTGREFSAPVSGEHQQTVQMADLNGDGLDEYLLFAKGTAEKPLQIFIFSGDGKKYERIGTIESSGSSFQQVAYVDMDDRPGVEIVVGRQLSDQVVGSVSVYTMVDGRVEEIMKTSYSKFVCADMDRDRHQDLLILRPDEENPQRGVAELYTMKDGSLERFAQTNMSKSSDNIRRIMVGKLNDGYPAVYVASDAGSDAIITDVYALIGDQFANVTFSNESGTSVQTLRSYYVYADDIDQDGILELPDLIAMQIPEGDGAGQRQHLIRWYAMNSDGSEDDRMYTYHNFAGGWYVKLNSEIASRIAAVQRGSSYEFYLWDESFQNAEKLMTIHALTGSTREEQAASNNRFVLNRTDSTVYAAELEVVSGAYGMSRDGLIESFRLIVEKWYTGET
jgi:hypothetical protein